MDRFSRDLHERAMDLQCNFNTYIASMSPVAATGKIFQESYG